MMTIMLTPQIQRSV